MELNEAVIVAYGRSAITKGVKGSLKDEHPADFAAQVLKGVLAKTPNLTEELIDDVIVGCAKPEGVQGSNLGRIIVQRAGISDEVPAQTVNRYCSSGLQAISIAATAIMCGQYDIAVAGGVETMSMIPMASEPSTRNKYLVEHNSAVYMPMGITAENVAEKYKITREEMDKFAVASQLKAAKAQEEGKFKNQIIPVKIVAENGAEKIISEDEIIRKNSTMEGLAALKPCFKEDGLVTAATSSPISDGVSFVTIMSKAKAEELKIKPIAKFIAYSVAGVAPNIMGIGPMKAVPKVLKKSGLSIDDMDVIEINEAFAAQAIPCIRELKMDEKKVNPNGGAIALGHPLGATGAILTCKALDYLEENNGKYALVTMCIGGGMGAACIFERL